MQATETPIKTSIVLVGGGNSHLVTLRKWGMRPISGASLTLISETSVNLYSAMVPALLAGTVRREAIELDLGRAAAAWGVRFIVDRVVGVDRASQRVLFQQRPPVRYDLLSLNVGSVPAIPSITSRDPRMIALRPLGAFVDTMEQLKGSRIRIAIVGGGATGAELAFSLLRCGFQVTVLEARLECEFGDVLTAAGVELHFGANVTGLTHSGVGLSTGETVACDRVIFATHASPGTLPSGLDLDTDDRGFIRVRDTLQTIGDPKIFASGDCASTESRPRLQKNGVYAVRMGNTLFENFSRVSAGQPPERFRNSGIFLSLVDCGDGKAFLSYGPVRFRARWALKLKRSIDADWVRSFVPKEMLSTGEVPKCGGCGSKLPSAVLSRVLERLDVEARAEFVVGCKDGEDAAVVRLPEGKVEVQTVDFFRSFVNDPYFFGRLAAIHAVSDLHAMNATPFSALAIVTLPPAKLSVQEALLEELMRGALESFRRLGVTLAGGHTTEGAELALGFSVTGFANEEKLFRKGGLTVGDKLVLTKRLGTGAILAARMRGQCRSEWFDEMERDLLQPNDRAAEIFSAAGVVAGTDVTGFGIAGHLLEMLKASRTSARLWSTEVNLYDGFKDVSERGILSTLHADNARFASQMEGETFPEWLFDPQTCGGLLCGVQGERADEVVAKLRRSGYPHAVIVGEVVPSQGGANLIIESHPRD